MADPQILVRQMDPASDRAVFRQIADHLREAIRNGRLRAGDKLPSEAQLMEHYNVARMTVRQAIQELKAEGHVVSEHGRGVFVRLVSPVKRLASDRFARRHRKEGKAAFLAESEAVGATSRRRHDPGEGGAGSRRRRRTAPRISLVKRRVPAVAATCSTAGRWSCDLVYPRGLGARNPDHGRQPRARWHLRETRRAGASARTLRGRRVHANAHA